MKSAQTVTKHRKQTIREIRQLRFPEQLAYLERRRYANPECLAAFLDVCDQITFESPSLGVRVACQAPPYAERVFAAGAGASLRLRAEATLGNAYLAAGRLDEADRQFRKAAAFDADADENAYLACRLSRLLTEQQRWPEAHAAAERAVSHFEERYDPDRPELETDRLSLAAALVFRANVHVHGSRFEAGDLEQAAEDLTTALTVCGKRTERSRLAALHNLGTVAAAAWIGGQPALASPSQVVELMRLVRRSLHRQKKIRHRSVVHAKTRWVMGLALAQESMGLTPRAENYLRGARDDLIALESYADAAMITLDLGWWLLQERRWPKLRAIATDLVTAPWARRFSTEWQAALELWQRSVVEQEVDREAISRVYRTVRGIRVRLPARRDETRRRWSTSIGW